MRCDICVARGTPSTIDLSGDYVRTAMGIHYYYDQKGNFHYHDPNTGSPLLRCSNGHKLIGRDAGSCNVQGCSMNYPSEKRWVED